MKRFDIAIIGAGPAGSSAAIQLGAKGYAVALLDKEKFPREKLCGDFLNPVNWPMLRELKVDRAVLACPHEKISIFRLTSFSGEEAEIPLPAGRDETSVGLGLRRFDLDYVLLGSGGDAGSVGGLPVSAKVRE
jgi:flavin-dependent dehydrogenase